MASRVSTNSSVAGSTKAPVERMRTVAGHLGHLTQKEEVALVEFKKICAEQELYTPASSERDLTRKASHDDGTMLRFLRARKFHVLDAFKQFKDTEVWRKTNQIDAVYENIDVDEYDETRRLYPQWTGRRDRRGIPLYLFEVRHLNSKAMAAYEQSLKRAEKKTAPATSRGPNGTPTKFLRLFALYENLTRFVMPLCSAVVQGRPNPETPITQSSNIVDISGVGLKQFWNLRSHMQDASTLATAHYPETLDRIFIIGAPSFFPTVWAWIKNWFDPITVSKIFILSASEVKPVLTELIPPANIPKKYGGELDFEFGMVPNIEPAMEEALEWVAPQSAGGSKRTFPMGPVRWEDGTDGSMTAVAVGSVGGKHRHDPIALVRPRAEGQQQVVTADLPSATTANGYAASTATTPPGEATKPLQTDTLPAGEAIENEKAQAHLEQGVQPTPIQGKA
ncbi:MAG: hypothetical protein M1832_004849 [Thelocarpon impressellum]|nr:MAG: hypothetical protein M1832_004849 [Thelocarpon impressellum]